MSARRILVLRHAKSDWSEPGQSDFDRPLALRGRRAAAAMGAYMLEECLIPDFVLCSAARRAVETWDIVSRATGTTPRIEHDEGLYLADSGTLFNRARTVDADIACLLFVGHAPGLEDFARRLSGDKTSPDWRRLAAKFPTGALAVLEMDTTSWRETAEGSARLDRFVVPKDLL